MNKTLIYCAGAFVAGFCLGVVVSERRSGKKVRAYLKSAPKDFKQFEDRPVRIPEQPAADPVDNSGILVGKPTEESVDPFRVMYNDILKETKYSEEVEQQEKQRYQIDADICGNDPEFDGVTLEYDKENGILIESLTKQPIDAAYAIGDHNVSILENAFEGDTLYFRNEFLKLDYDIEIV